MHTADRSRRGRMPGTHTRNQLHRHPVGPSRPGTRHPGTRRPACKVRRSRTRCTCPWRPHCTWPSRSTRYKDLVSSSLGLALRRGFRYRCPSNHHRRRSSRPRQRRHNRSRRCKAGSPRRRDSRADMRMRSLRLDHRDPPGNRIHHRLDSPCRPGTTRRHRPTRSHSQYHSRTLARHAMRTGRSRRTLHSGTTCLRRGMRSRVLAIHNRDPSSKSPHPHARGTNRRSDMPRREMTCSRYTPRERRPGG